jgi:aspartate/methionine/tyrosine aminotransferase
MPLAERVATMGDAPEAGRQARVDLTVPAHVVDAVRTALLRGETHYTSRPGMPDLRARVADALAWLGGPIYDPGTSLVITTGARESLFVVLLGLRPAPGTVYVSGAAAREYASLFHLMQVVPIEPSAFVTDTVGLLYRECESDAAGHQRLLQFAERRGLIDVLNIREAIGSAPVASLPRVSPDRTIVIGSLDALPGVRAFGVGFVAGPPAVMGRVRTWKQAFSICTAAPSQRAALAAIDAWRKEAQ